MPAFRDRRGLDRRQWHEKLHQLLMIAASDPNMVIAGFAVGGLALAVFWRFIVWIREAPVRPDPWDAETEQKISEPDAQEVCPHCSTPQPPGAWFCAHCGRAVGPYNNLMPYVQVFSEGEVFRNGTSGRFRTAADSDRLFSDDPGNVSDFRADLLAFAFAELEAPARRSQNPPRNKTSSRSQLTSPDLRLSRSCKSNRVTCPG